MKTIILSTEEQEALQKSMKKYQKDWKVLRRLRCIDMRSKKVSLQSMMQILQVSNATIAHWCEQYLEQGLTALCTFHYEGRRLSKLSSHQKLIEELVDTETHNTYAELLHAVEERVGAPIGIKWDGFVKFCKKNSIGLQRSVE